ncbi:MAG TPA: acyl-CoA dehydrogenase family protein [Kofleriaceae bacterium]|nr:acyl-CoA dehydrogenase family protein [Kofleriaceae bacterium]
MAFFQAPPKLDNQFDSDALLREYLSRRFPADALATHEEEYRHLGALAAGPLYREMLADRQNEPVLTQWDPWGHRIDAIEVSPLWKKAQVIAAEHGLVAAAYEQKLGGLSRVHQFVLNYLVQASLDVYSCPLAMTDGAARTLLDSGNRELSDLAVPRLTSRDPDVMWTSGQWMTERTGGSDVGLSETIARRDGDAWRLYGTKWFTSATTSQMALTLARPEDNGPGGRGLALFFVQLRNADGSMRNIAVNRLKDKFGTRKVPTAELSLEGTPAVPVVGLRDGIKNIAPMLNITRTWNAMGCAWAARRSIALARDYAHRRRAFGAPLAEKPLHVDTLASLAAEAEAVFLLAFLAAELCGKREAGEATEREELLFRVLTPIAKLTTAKQAVAIASETLESFGGAGYIEDTGLPRILADAQVMPIWEGTTNVLSLDTLRALAQPGAGQALAEEIEARVSSATQPALKAAGEIARRAFGHALSWAQSAAEDRPRMEAGARRFALTLGRSLELSLLIDHASWCLDHGRSPRAAAAAQRFSRTTIDHIDDFNLDETALLSAG